MAEDQRLTPGAGSLFIACSDRIDDTKAVFRNSIWGFDGANWNRAIVDASGAFKVTGSGGGGGGTVDQGLGGTDPWLIEGAVTITGTVDVSGSTVITGGLTDAELRAAPVPVSGPLTDVQLRATPVPVSGTVTITDGSGPVTVDGTVTANQGTSPWVVGGTVAVSNQNTQYTEGDVDSSITGNAVLGETTGNTLTPIQIDGNGALKVVGNGGTLVTNDAANLTDNTAFTDGSSFVGMAGYILDETPGTALAENDAAAARIDSKRAQVLVIEDATTRGQRAAVSSGGALSVDTELETPAALADGQSNPTLPRVGAIQLRAKYVDGTLSFDRLPHSYYQNRTGAGNASGAGTTIDMTMGPCRTFGLQVENGTGTTSAWNIDLQGSMDGTSFFQILNQTNATGTAQLSNVGDKCVRFIRSFVNSVTGGGTVRIRILGLRE